MPGLYQFLCLCVREVPRRSVVSSIIPNVLVGRQEVAAIAYLGSLKGVATWPRDTLLTFLLVISLNSNPYFPSHLAFLHLHFIAVGRWLIFS